MKHFRFMPQWKEELVCECSGGSFILEAPMGIFSVYLPTEPSWQRQAPDWARPLWPRLRAELEDWCGRDHAKFYIEESATAYRWSAGADR